MSNAQIFWSKELSTAVDMLNAAGFKCISRSDSPSIWGSTEPEPCDVGKHHFRAILRDVFVGECQNGQWYASSCLIGDIRFYRCRTVHTNHKILNIFAYGNNPVEAVEKFLTNFKNKTYNLGINIGKK